MRLTLRSSASLFAFSALLLTLVFAAPACASHHEATSPHESAIAPANDKEAALSKVAAIHGGAGPWVVAGYRMGEFALTRLSLPAQSFDLEVIHHSPHEVQFSCIADGAAAATGASMGKLNLRLEDADAAHTATTYRKKSTGESVTLKPTAAFEARFKDIPRPKLGEAGSAVMDLRDEEIFEEVK